MDCKIGIEPQRNALNRLLINRILRQIRIERMLKMMQQVPVEFCLSQSEQDWAELLPHAPFGGLREWSTMIQVSCKAKRTI
ncbi:hypothetical protein D9M72_561310 [compost metagenome]